MIVWLFGIVRSAFVQGEKDSKPLSMSGNETSEPCRWDDRDIGRKSPPAWDSSMSTDRGSVSSFRSSTCHFQHKAETHRLRATRAHRQALFVRASDSSRPISTDRTGLHRLQIGRFASPNWLSVSGFKRSQGFKGCLPETVVRCGGGWRRQQDR